LVNEEDTPDQHRNEWLISTKLWSVLDSSLDIWLVERRVCVWPSWFRSLLVRACFFALLVPLVGGSCFPNLFSVTCPILPLSSFFSPKIPPVFSVNCILWTGVKLLINALSSSLKGKC